MSFVVERRANDTNIKDKKKKKGERTGKKKRSRKYKTRNIALAPVCAKYVDSSVFFLPRKRQGAHHIKNEKKKRNDTCSFLLYIAFNSVCERRNTDDHEPNCGFAKCIKKEKLFFRFRYPPPSLPSSVNSRSAQQGYIVRSHQGLVSADTMRANRRRGGGVAKPQHAPPRPPFYGVFPIVVMSTLLTFKSVALTSSGNL